MVLSHQRPSILASIFHAIFMNFPNHLPEAIFRGSMCPSIHKLLNQISAPFSQLRFSILAGLRRGATGFSRRVSLKVTRVVVRGRLKKRQRKGCLKKSRFLLQTQPSERSENFKQYLLGASPGPYESYGTSRRKSILAGTVRLKGIKPFARACLKNNLKRCMRILLVRCCVKSVRKAL